MDTPSSLPLYHIPSLHTDPTDDIQTTVGLNSQVLSKGWYRIRLLDLGGGPDIRDIWHHYYAEVSIQLILVKGKYTISIG